MAGLIQSLACFDNFIAGTTNSNVDIPHARNN